MALVVRSSAVWVTKPRQWRNLMADLVPPAPGGATVPTTGQIWPRGNR